MKKVIIAAAILTISQVFSQTQDFKRAPNSYIFDVTEALDNNYGGIYIPVKKAYEMWNGYDYLKINGSVQPVPSGTLSASMYWEDNPGLVTDVTLLQAANPADSKIKVSLDSHKKGNAVIAFKVNDEIFWSWHIWATDNPSYGVSYGQGYETDANMQPVSIEYMDRNLGAVGNNFTGNNWDKSGGLMYEWGRKDPFPPLVNKDGYFYELNGEAGNLKHKSVDPLNTIPEKIREFNEIEKNIAYSVKNPLTYIINTDASGNWFSSSRYKVNGTDVTNYVSWDLWGDNTKGKHSNANSSSTALKNDSRSYELKSELDPCPNGWRVPSYYGRVTQNNNLSPWGRKGNWNNDDPSYSQIKPNQAHPTLDGVKVYPGLGMDFTNAYYGQRNMGIMPVSGGYVYYPNSSAPNAPAGIMFQDNMANGATWSATYGYDGARVFSMVSDHFRTNTSVGLHGIWINQTHPTRSGNAVRCMKDPNLALIGNFATEYFFVANNAPELKDGLYQPNSFVVSGHSALKIPVKKAFAVHQKYFADSPAITGNLLVKVLWTTSPSLITKVTVQPNPVPAEGHINVEFLPGEVGNAVVTLYSSDAPENALWSWHIWVPDSDPSIYTENYVTENTLPANGNFVNPTASKLPPISNVFMDRNLGAISKMPVTADITLANAAKGLHYQWGRKDPLPTFSNGTVIYKGTDLGENLTQLNFQQIDQTDYENMHTEEFSQYASGDPQKNRRVIDHIQHSVAKPLNFLYHQGTGTLYDGGSHQNDLSQVRDWVLNERNQSPERWGHADEKSVFDPCPHGWRVPDASFTHLYTGSKGNSPWYSGYSNDAYGKPGVIQDQWQNVENFYNGEIIGNLGWVFKKNNYTIGNFPADGIRGELGGKDISYQRSGVWTASLADRATGYALAMQFQGNKMQTGTGVYPQAAMGVRCARDFSVRLGKPKGNFDMVFKNAPKNNVVQPVTAKIAVAENGSVLHVEGWEGNYQIFDQSGRLLLQGKVSNGQIGIGVLNAGMFIVRFADDNKEQNLKFIKK